MRYATAPTLADILEPTAHVDLVLSLMAIITIIAAYLLFRIRQRARHAEINILRATVSSILGTLVYGLAGLYAVMSVAPLIWGVLPFIPLFGGFLFFIWGWSVLTGVRVVIPIFFSRR